MSKKFVVFECNGKQYIATEGDVISVDLMDVDAKENITIDTVLLLSDKGKVTVGQPYTDNIVTAEILAHERDKKVHVFKFKKKTGYKKKQGHKQRYTTIKISSISTGKVKKEKTDKSVKDTEKKVS